MICSCHTPFRWWIFNRLSHRLSFFWRDKLWCVLTGKVRGLLLLLVVLAASGCVSRDFCRDANGKFERCPSKKVLNTIGGGL